MALSRKELAHIAATAHNNLFYKGVGREWNTCTPTYRATCVDIANDICERGGASTAFEKEVARVWLQHKDAVDLIASLKDSWAAEQEEADARRQKDAADAQLLLHGAIPPSEQSVEAIEWPEALETSAADPSEDNQATPQPEVS